MPDFDEPITENGKFVPHQSLSTFTRSLYIKIRSSIQTWFWQLVLGDSLSFWLNGLYLIELKAVLDQWSHFAWCRKWRIYISIWFWWRKKEKKTFSFWWISTLFIHHSIITFTFYICVYRLCSVRALCFFLASTKLIQSPHRYLMMFIGVNIFVEVTWHLSLTYRGAIIFIFICA